MFFCVSTFIGERKLILIIHQPEIQRLKFFLIHLALLFRFVYVSLWNNIRSLKIFTRRTGEGFRGRRWAVRWFTFVSPDSFLSFDISLVLYFYIYKTSIKWVSMSFFTLIQAFVKPTRRWKMKNIWIIYFLVTQGFLTLCMPITRPKQLCLYRRLIIEFSA